MYIFLTGGVYIPTVSDSFSLQMLFPSLLMGERTRNWKTPISTDASEQKEKATKKSSLPRHPSFRIRFQFSRHMGSLNIMLLAFENR